jgi:DNA invertase Pin-like site-specific DNA recombinase
MNAKPVPRFVAYLRVSTDKQGRSGLGLEGQREAVVRHVASAGGRIVAEFVEVESGRKADRPRLAEALAACREHHAVLLVAKLDRLTRNARFLLGVVEGSGEGGVVFCDLPTLPAGPVGKFMLTQMAAVAELEAGLIGQRTKAALAAAKARGKKLGGKRAGSPDMAPHAKQGNAASVAARRKTAGRRVADLAPTVRELQGQGITSLAALARELTARGVSTPRGGAKWQAVQVGRVLAAMGEAGAR